MHQASPDARYPCLSGKTAIVTGGASGIGEQIVRSFHGQGTHVAFIDIQAEQGATLASALDGRSARALFVHADLTDINALEGAFSRIKGKLGPAHILVNNAASDAREVFGEVTVEGYDHLMDTNLRHVFFASQLIVPQMREHGHGAIINMSSGTALSGDLRLPSYATAKAAILGLTYSLARGLGPSDNIRVNAVVPGSVRTEKQKRTKGEEARAATVAGQLLSRDILPEDIAQTVLFLASDQSSMITRQMIVVNGGSR